MTFSTSMHPPAPSIRLVIPGLAALTWPLLVMFLHPWTGFWPLLLAGTVLACWRLPTGYKRWGLVLALVATPLAVLGHAEFGVRAWPVMVNFTLLGVFAWSLGQPQSLIERVARRQDPDLPPSGARYTRRVTQVWCVFFLCNGMVALWTALYADLATWTLYNGGIAYFLCATLFVIEWCVRQRVRSRQQ